MNPRPVAILAFDGVQPLDVTGPYEVFAGANQALGIDLAIERLAALVAMSPRHFQREFRRQLGVPPGRYVDRVRVEAARRVLEDEPATNHRPERTCRADRHPVVPRVHRAGRHRALRGPPAHPGLRHHVHRPRAR